MPTEQPLAGQRPMAVRRGIKHHLDHTLDMPISGRHGTHIQTQAQRQGRPHGLGVEPLSFDLTRLEHIGGQCGQGGLIAQRQPQVGQSPQQ